MTITTIENLLDLNQYSYCEQRFTDPSIHWYYLPWTADTRDSGEYAGSFSHLIFANGEGISPLWEPSLHILFRALDLQEQTLESVLRVRLGLITRAPRAIQHKPHIDQSVKHRTAIWYPRTSSGDTVVFNERAILGSELIPDNYTVMHSQQPTANLWFDFDGQHWHSSTTPDQHEQRYVLTFNYTVKR